MKKKRFNKIRPDRKKLLRKLQGEKYYDNAFVVIPLNGLNWLAYTGRISNEFFETFNKQTICFIVIVAKLMQKAPCCLDYDAILLFLSIAGLYREPHIQLYIAIAFSERFFYAFHGEGGCCADDVLSLNIRSQENNRVSCFFVSFFCRISMFAYVYSKIQNVSTYLINMNGVSYYFLGNYGLLAGWLPDWLCSFCNCVGFTGAVCFFSLHRFVLIKINVQNAMRIAASV